MNLLISIYTDWDILNIYTHAFQMFMIIWYAVGDGIDDSVRRTGNLFMSSSH